MRAYWEQTREQSGRSQKHASYWLCVLLLRQYLFFTLLRRHIFVFFTRSFSLRPLLCPLSLASCYLVPHIVGLGLDINHGFAKTLVENSEVTKKRAALEKRLHNGEQWAVKAKKRCENAGRLYSKLWQQT